MQATLRSPRAVNETSDDSGQPGGASVGALLRRLSERIDRDANRVYSQLGAVFEQRWMGVLNLLALRGPMSVKELAAVLDRRSLFDRVQARLRVGARRGPSRVDRNSTARQRIPAIDPIVPQHGTTTPKRATRGMAHAAPTASKDSP